MSPTPQLTLTLDRRLLEHPRAVHLRRMRLSVWLYLALLSRLPAGSDRVEVEPGRIGTDMGLPEATIRSWLGHLRKWGYVSVARQNGTVELSVRRDVLSEPVQTTSRFFTVRKLQRILKDSLSVGAFEAALRLYPDPVIRRALAGALSPPDEQIKRSRTALFLYLLKRHGHASPQ